MPNRLPPAALDPALDVDQRQRAFLVGRLPEGAGMQVLDPGVLRARGIARQGEPHQAAGALAGNGIALEQHHAKQRLSLVLALVGGKSEPAGSELGVLLADGTLEIEPAEIVLR